MRMLATALVLGALLACSSDDGDAASIDADDGADAGGQTRRDSGAGEPPPDGADAGGARGQSALVQVATKRPPGLSTRATSREAGSGSRRLPRKEAAATPAIEGAYLRLPFTTE